MVAYRAPCGRRLRNMQELDKYLMLTDSQMAVDHFCYDPVLHVCRERIYIDITFSPIPLFTIVYKTNKYFELN
jgi:histone-lysine N-methyltransferase SETDB1